MSRPPPPAPLTARSPYISDSSSRIANSLPYPYSSSPIPRSYAPTPVVPAGGFPSPAQLVAKVPLIKSPSFWVPKPIELPPDIHPLPEDVTDYFVYPHTLEAHSLSTLPQQLEELRQVHSQRLHLLSSLADSKEKARRAALNKLAPGFEGTAVMQPIRKDSVMIGPATSLPSRSSRGARKKKTEEPRSVLEEEQQDEDLLGSPRKNLNLFGSPTETELNTESTMDAAETAQLKALVEGLEAMDARRSSNEGSLLVSPY